MIDDIINDYLKNEFNKFRKDIERKSKVITIMFVLVGIVIVACFIWILTLLDIHIWIMITSTIFIIGSLLFIILIVSENISINVYLKNSILLKDLCEEYFGKAKIYFKFRSIDNSDVILIKILQRLDEEITRYESVEKINLFLTTLSLVPFYKFLEVIGIMSQTYLLNLLVVIPLMILYFVIVIVTSNRVYNKEYINKKKRIKILRDNLKYIYFEKFVKSRTK